MAAEKTNEQQDGNLPTFTEAEKKKARAWFKKAEDVRERRDYDYAIESFITGLGFWPEAVEEGHMPLRSLSIQRQQAGGKKPGKMEAFKKSMSGKDAKKAMLNAEYLLAKDPTNANYLDGLLKNAAKGGYLHALKWVTPLVFDSLKKDKKPSKGRYKLFRETLVEAAEKADEAGDPVLSCWLLENAVNSIDHLMARQPGDEELRTEQRDLSGKLAIVKGKYAEADTFRESLQDAGAQKVLHDRERFKQAEETFEAALAAARKEVEEHPNNPNKIYALADLLKRREDKEHDDQAVAVLMEAYQRTKNYNFKLRADDVRLTQLRRQVRQLEAKAKKTGTDEDRQQARLARLEYAQTELSIYRERVSKYPTDLRLKFRLGRALFQAREFEEAIPMLQASQDDPRVRYQAWLLMGRAFFEQDSNAQAADVLNELLEAYDLTDDLSKEALYWRARALEADGQNDEARTAYGKLLRQDYNYADGEARRRLDELNKKKQGAPEE